MLIYSLLEKHFFLLGCIVWLDKVISSCQVHLDMLNLSLQIGLTISPRYANIFISGGTKESWILVGYNWDRLHHSMGQLYIVGTTLKSAVSVCTY